MKHLFPSLLFLLLVGGEPVFATPGGKGKENAGDGSEGWIARVNGQPIDFDEYVRRYTDFIFSNGIKDNLLARRAILDNMINEELLLHHDTRTSVLYHPDYLNDVARAETRIVLAYLKDQEIYAKITVDERELRQAFLRTNEKLAARHLYATTEEEANSLYELLKMGVGFDFLAEQVFTDSVLRNNGGYLGYFSWGDMDPAFEEAAYSLRVGEISPPVRTAQGYSIIRLEDRLSHPLLTENMFSQKKSHLEAALRMRKKAPAEVEYLQEILHARQVVYHDEELNILLSDLDRWFTAGRETDRVPDMSAVCAAYDQTTYSRGDLLRRLSKLPVDQRQLITSMEVLKSAVRGLMTQDRLLSVARQKGYDTLETVRQTFEKTKNSLFLKYRFREIADQTHVPDSLILEYYRTHIDRFSTEHEINVQEILVNDRTLADSLKNAIAAGADFGTLARQHSMRKWSAENDGIMGFAPLSRFGQLRGTLWDATIGEVVGPIAVAEVFGLFRVFGKTEVKPISFDRIRGRVEQEFKFENQRTAVRRYLDRLRENVAVDIN
ncbi:MAG: peptidylprolyl isomerase, partial [Ignavibacteriales bacterium]|nr:peptidylprolyl isomerase [Ignavibacteriales bacterium]